MASAKPPTKQSPVDVARETFRQLSLTRTQPTPDAYRKLYNDIAGFSDEPAHHISPLQNSQEAILRDLLNRTLTFALPTLLTTAPELSAESDALSRLLKQSKSEQELLELGTRLKNLCFRIEQLPVSSIKPMLAERLELAEPLIPMLSKLLSQTLKMAVGALLENDPALRAIPEQLSVQVSSAKSLQEFKDIETHIKDLCYKITLKGDDASEQLQLLLSLFKLLLENVSSLLEDDNWLRGQIVIIQELITGNIDHRALLAATKGLKEVIYRQSALKDSIAQSKISVKELMDLFVARLNVFANSTGAYHEKVTAYTGKITPNSSSADINQLIDSLLADTLEVQSETKQSVEMMLTAQKEVQKAESRIQLLERKLADMSNQVLKDQLTGSLNRRGLDELLEREAARADRRKSALCFGMLDIDNFKKLNDTYGHVAGDEALVHLVNVIKKTLRTMDIVARYGGEEFAVIMPETELQHAAHAMVRLQRELTKHFFMAGQEQVLITFSAGVAERHPAEDLAALIIRADKAMYQAKAAGKNRVMTADE